MYGLIKDFDAEVRICREYPAMLTYEDLDAELEFAEQLHLEGETSIGSPQDLDFDAPNKIALYPYLTALREEYKRR